MSWLSNLSDHLKRMVLLDDKIERLSKDLDGMRDVITDHEKRLIRIETMIEMGARHAGVDKLDGN